MRSIAVLGFASSVLALAPGVAAQESRPAVFEVHEIGYLDANHSQTWRGWLSSIPEGTPISVSTIREATRGWRSDIPSRPNDPALLFHADRRLLVQVTVGFARGAPVAWWPSGEVHGRQLVFRDVVVDPQSRAPRPETLDVRRYPGLIPLRNLRGAGATPVWVDGRKEAGLVYEGVLPYQPDVVVSVPDSRTIEIRNTGTLPLRDVIVVPEGERERGLLVGKLEAGATVAVPVHEATLEPLGTILDLRLLSSGLFAGEAKALRETVLAPDFREGRGVRLLARVPTETWDRSFPIQISPLPRQVIRVGILRLFDAARYRTRPAAPEAAPETSSGGAGTPPVVVAASPSARRTARARRPEPAKSPAPEALAAVAPVEAAGGG